MLADQSLRNLQATRVMNRDEIAQDDLQELDHQQQGTQGQSQANSRTQSPATAVVNASGSNTSGGGVVSNAASSNNTTRTTAKSNASATTATGPGIPSSPNRRGVVVESDTALWAMDNGSDEDDL